MPSNPPTITAIREMCERATDLEHLRRFQQHQLQLDDQYGAEILHHALRELKQNRTDLPWALDRIEELEECLREIAYGRIPAPPEGQDMAAEDICQWMQEHARALLSELKVDE